MRRSIGTALMALGSLWVSSTACVPEDLSPDASSGGTDAGSGETTGPVESGSVLPEGGGASAGSEPPPICEVPAPWPLPTSHKVVGTGSAASCTADALRQAVSAGGYVSFACGEAAVSINIPSAIQISKATVVDGANNVTLDGGGKSQIFVVADNNSLSVRNLRFINGKAPPSNEAAGIGGAVAGKWRTKLEVLHCTFEDNTAGRGGGAVSVWTGSSLTVVASRFLRNHSWYGGAIYSLLSPLQVVNSEFTDNVTLTDMGTGDGGAIGTDGASEYPDDATGGQLAICGSTFRNNRAEGLGGAAYLWVYPPDQVIIDRTTVEGNRVGKNAKGTAFGGAMRISNGDITVKSSSFLSNSADSHGGALYLDCAPTCTITNSTFYGNRASSYGGAIFGDRLRVNNATFAKNHAGGHGGALFGGPDWTLRNSIFVDNEAGNPWNQAYSCGVQGRGDHVLQWLSAAGNGGSDPCIPGVLAADPKLAAPADNGGPTFTMLPLASSPALAAGADCESVDQRGRARMGGACDLGAVEVP